MVKKNPFDGLLFDLDGTLLDTAPDFISSMNVLMARHGEPKIGAEGIRLNVTNGSAGLIQHAFNVSPESREFKTLRNELLSIYEKHIVEKTALFPGIKQVLDECAERSIPWGIVTNKPWMYTETILEKLDLMDRVACAICPDHVQRPKPDPESLYLACKKLRLKPSQCIYIGDHIRDILAGSRAAMSTIVAAWGYIDPDENLSEWGANWIVERSQGLHKFLFEKMV